MKSTLNYSLPYIIEVSDQKKSAIQYILNVFTARQNWLKKKLLIHGAILFRSNLSLNMYFELLEKVNFEYVSYVGGDSPRAKLNNKIYTSTEYPSDQMIVLHNEMSFSNTYPRYLFFYCELAARSGGETPLADARKLYRLLPEELIRQYQEKKLKYIMNLHGGFGLGKSWQQVFETDNKVIVEQILKSRKIIFFWRADGTLCLSEIIQPIVTHPITGERLFFSQAHQWHSSNLDKQIKETLLNTMPENEFYHYVSYANDEPLSIKDLELTKKNIDEIKVDLAWKEGDMLLIDNLLTMHGRNSYKGSRKILLSMANGWE